jgi:hypothetical protein
MTDRRKRGQRTVNGRPLRSANARLVAEHDAALARIEGLAAQVQTCRELIRRASIALEPGATAEERREVRNECTELFHALAATSGEPPPEGPAPTESPR